jgi:glycosyltransferase involved in cell wall biosynthesis
MSETENNTQIDDNEIDLTVVLPACNEEEMLGSTITNLITGLDEKKYKYEIIIVENGSHDGTLRLARMLGAQLPQLRVFTLPVGNYGAALKTGFLATRGQVVVSFDVDYYDFSFLDKAFEMIIAGTTDVVVASKRAPGANNQREALRKLVTAVFTTVLRSLFDMKVTDAHGMKAFRRETVQKICEQCVTTESLFEVEMIIRAGNAGLNLSEIPATVIEQRPARSHILRRVITAIPGLFTLQRALGFPAIKKIIGIGQKQNNAALKTSRSNDSSSTDKS